MKEIVINTCFGGFGLSHKAIMRYAEIKGIKLFPHIDEITKEVYKEKAVLENPSINIHYTTKPVSNEKELDANYFSKYDIERDDPALVQVVKEMGEAANGQHAELKIVEIPDDIEWNLEEYDGVESIHEAHRSWS